MPRALADELVHNGKVSAPEWVSALRAVPRHEFLPEFYEQHGAEWREVSADSDPQRWWGRVCSDVPLVTRLGTLPNGASGPTSSSSAPGLMARMLEALDVQDHCSVCEIGTGTGYNAALLAHRLDAEQALSVDIDANLVGTARERLRRTGREPHLAAFDGSCGWPHGGVFDRLVATCAVDRIPPAWLHQTSERGLLLCDLKIGVSAGNLVALRQTGDAAEGRFVDGFASFMSLREGKTHQQQHPRRDRGRVRHRHTRMTEGPWASPVPWLLACLEMAGAVRFGYSPTSTPGIRPPSS